MPARPKGAREGGGRAAGRGARSGCRLRARWSVALRAPSPAPSGAGRGAESAVAVEPPRGAAGGRREGSAGGRGKGAEAREGRVAFVPPPFSHSAGRGGGAGVHSRSAGGGGRILEHGTPRRTPVFRHRPGRVGDADEGARPQSDRQTDRPDGQTPGAPRPGKEPAQSGRGSGLRPRRRRQPARPGCQASAGTAAVLTGPRGRALWVPAPGKPPSRTPARHIQRHRPAAPAHPAPSDRPPAPGPPPRWGRRAQSARGGRGLHPYGH